VRKAGAILEKDVVSLLPMVALTALLFFGDALITRLDLLPTWTLYGPAVLLVAMLVLVLSVFQLDSPASPTDDWLCRPVRIRDLLAAKFALLALTIYLARAMGVFAADLALGFSVPEASQDALLFPDTLFPFLLPIFLFTAIVTRTFVQGFGVLFVIFICAFVIPTPFVRPPGPLSPGLREALWSSGMAWLAATPAKIACLILVATGFWLAYRRRLLTQARVLLAVTVCVTLTLLVLPMGVLPGSSTFALQKSFGPATRSSDPRLSLRNTELCFAAARGSELATDPAFDAARRKAGLGLWSEEEELGDVGPNAVAFVTNIEPRGLPLDWRAKLGYVDARYTAGGEIGYSLRPAAYLTDISGGGLLSHAWMLPEPAVQRLRGLEPQLLLTYSLALLEPREYPVRIDHRRHALPGLGFCSATAEPDNRITVDCFSAFSHPAQISAELHEIPASRVYGSVNFAPGWTRWPYSERTRLSIGSSRLTTHDSVTVTAWHVAGYRNASLKLPGILGADLATCPLPGDRPRSLAQTRWSDTAPHEAQSISVDQGVQLEVLDFGGEGSPIVLLPGLGATAHAFDDLAPQLARKHRVVAITRRGTGYSSRPDFGFDTPRLGRDVLAVLDHLGLRNVLLVGHSIAGEELTWLGENHAERFSGLVYLDAAYDRAAERGDPRNTRLRELQRGLPPEPPIPPQALLDFGVMSQLLAERGHNRYPEGELIAFLNMNKPFVAGSPGIDALTRQAIMAAIRAPEYGAVKIPALAIYAFEDPERPLPPWYPDDEALRARVTEIRQIDEAMKRENIELFRRGVAEGEVLEVPDATHYIIQSNPREVREAIEKFSARLAAAPR
jgi:pimeloyl-ACP methyl ester carboxylesterase